MSNLTKILEVMLRHELRTIVIGGHAVNFHGYVRATEDIDLLVLPDDGWRDRTLSALGDLNAFVITDEIDSQTGIERVRPIDPADIAARDLIMVGSDYGYLDLFSFPPGLEMQALDAMWETSVRSGEFRFVSLAWLRRMKELSARPVDLNDLENLPEP